MSQKCEHSSYEIGVFDILWLWGPKGFPPPPPRERTDSRTRFKNSAADSKTNGQPDSKTNKRWIQKPMASQIQKPRFKSHSTAARLKNQDSKTSSTQIPKPGASLIQHPRFINEGSWIQKQTLAGFKNHASNTRTRPANPARPSRKVTAGSAIGPRHPQTHAKSSLSTSLFYVMHWITYLIIYSITIV